jgi:hypothetical protein
VQSGVGQQQVHRQKMPHEQKRRGEESLTAIIIQKNPSRVPGKDFLFESFPLSDHDHFPSGFSTRGQLNYILIRCCPFKKKFYFCPTQVQNQKCF